MNLRQVTSMLATTAFVPLLTIGAASLTVSLTASLSASRTATGQSLALFQDESEAEAARADAKTAFKEAVKLHKAIRGLKGVARREAQERAAAAFVAVADRFPADAKLGGRALFRAAQLYEHIKDRERGVQCLKRLFTLDAEPRTQARGHNLLGHVYRRSRNLPEAIKEYTVVMTRYPQIGTVVAETMGWLGKCKARLGDQSAARDVWRKRIERFSERDALVIETWDWIACSLFREGQREKAKTELGACRRRFADAPNGDARRAARIQKRLTNMRIVRLIEAEENATPGKPSSDG